MSLFGPPNIEKMKAKKNVRGLVKALGYKKDPQINDAAASALRMIYGPARTKIREHLIKALNSKDSQVQKRAVQILGHIKGESVVNPLIACLGDDFLRLAALRSLAMIGDKRAIEHLVAALEQGPAPLRRAIVQAMGKMGDRRACDSLIGALRDEDYFVRKSAVKSLQQIGWRPKWDETGAWHMIAKQEKGWEEKCHRLGEPALNPLLFYLDNGITPFQNSLDYFRVRTGAARVLGKLGDQRAIEPLRDAILGSSSIAVEKNTAIRSAKSSFQESAAMALGQIGGAIVIEPLREVLGSDDAFLRECAAKALGRVRSLKARDLLIPALKDPSMSVGAAAAEALGRHKRKQNVSPLLDAIRDTSVAVGKAALLSLGRIGDLSAVEPIIGLLGTMSPGVREVAVDSLVQFGEPVVESLIRALDDQGPTASWTTAETLRALYESDKLSDAGKQSILNQREKIERHHTYTRGHTDYDACIGHTDEVTHTDRHIDFNSAP